MRDEMEESQETRRKRNPNFTAQEMLALLELGKQNRHILTSQAKNTMTNRTKSKVWRAIADAVSQVSKIQRDIKDVKKKWQDLKGAVLKRRMHQRRTGDTKMAKKAPFEDVILDIIGDSEADGGYDASITETETSKGSVELKEACLDDSQAITMILESAEESSQNHKKGTTFALRPQKTSTTKPQEGTTLTLKPEEASILGLSIDADGTATVVDDLEVPAYTAAAHPAQAGDSNSYLVTLAEDLASPSSSPSPTSNAKFDLVKKRGLKRIYDQGSDSKLRDDLVKAKIRTHNSHQRLMDAQREFIASKTKLINLMIAEREKQFDL